MTDVQICNSLETERDRVLEHEPREAKKKFKESGGQEKEISCDGEFRLTRKRGRPFSPLTS